MTLKVVVAHVNRLDFTFPLFYFCSLCAIVMAWDYAYITHDITLCLIGFGDLMAFEPLHTGSGIRASSENFCLIVKTVDSIG